MAVTALLVFTSDSLSGFPFVPGLFRMYSTTVLFMLAIVCMQTLTYGNACPLLLRLHATRIDLFDGSASAKLIWCFVGPVICAQLSCITLSKLSLFRDIYALSLTCFCVGQSILTDIVPYWRACACNAFSVECAVLQTRRTIVKPWFGNRFISDF